MIRSQEAQRRDFVAENLQVVADLSHGLDQIMSPYYHKTKTVILSMPAAEVASSPNVR